MTNSQANILPVIVTNHTVTIAAELVRIYRLSMNRQTDQILSYRRTESD